MTETASMRMASRQWGGRDLVGIISPHGRDATPFALFHASRGVLPMIEMLVRAEPLRSPGINDDVIATGTPAAVGMTLKLPQRLKHGNVVRIETGGIGSIGGIESRIE
ncbi:MAG: hypothetical protein ABIR61_13970 [Casimicrobiaceae bacterium]